MHTGMSACLDRRQQRTKTHVKRGETECEKELRDREHVGDKKGSFLEICATGCSVTDKYVVIIIESMNQAMSK